MCFVLNFCRNDELSWLFTNRFSATRYMKVKRLGITEILRSIWLFSSNKIKSSESVSKQPTQLIIATEIRHILLTYYYSLSLCQLLLIKKENSMKTHRKKMHFGQMRGLSIADLRPDYQNGLSTIGQLDNFQVSNFSFHIQKPFKTIKCYLPLN